MTDSILNDNPPTRIALKRRSPWLSWLGAVLTLGIYWWVWYFQINRELADMGRRVSAGGAVAAVTIGAWVFIPPFVSVYNTGERIRETERDAGFPESELVGAGLGVFLYMIGGFNIVQHQKHLNAVIDAHEGVTV